MLNRLNYIMRLITAQDGSSNLAISPSDVLPRVLVSVPV